MPSFPADLVDAVAKALFEEQEDRNDRIEAELGLGTTPRERWDDPKNVHCHDGYRGRAQCALRATVEWNNRRKAKAALDRFGPTITRNLAP